MSDMNAMNSEPREIETLADLLEAARSTDDVDGLIEDLGVWIKYALEFPEQPLVKWKPKFLWKDDGERGVSGLRITVEGSS